MAENMAENGAMSPTNSLPPAFSQKHTSPPHHAMERSQSEPHEKKKGPRKPTFFKPMQFKNDSKSPKEPRKPEAGAAELELMKGMNNLVFEDKKYCLTREDIIDNGKIGNGVTGEVFRVLHNPTNKLMAAKKMVWLDHAEERKRVLMDLNVMSVHKSPHIVKYYGSAIWNNEVWVFMELMTTCLQRLSTKLAGPIPEDVLCKMAVSIVKALDYLKTQHKVIHRDVKPSNMLLDRDGNVKICDFGISGRLVDSQAFTRNAGCAAFMAPERIKQQNSTGGYDVRADIWSLGISLVQLATGSLPYSDKTFMTEFELLTYIVQASPPLPNEESFSPKFYDFLSKCLTKDVAMRPHYGNLLEHPLIKEYENRDIDVGAWLRKVETIVGL